MSASLVDIFVFAVVAGALALRLITVLGRHTGPTSSNDSAPTQDNLISLRDKRQNDDTRAEEQNENEKEDMKQAGCEDPVRSGLDEIKRQDVGFDLESFMKGAKSAYEMIMTAFANGDRDTLQPLLAEEVFEAFNKAIGEREQAKESLEIRIVEISDLTPVMAGVVGGKAEIALRIESRQISVLRNERGEVEDQGHNETETVTDVWIFARQLRSDDPNWRLVSTQEADLRV